MAEIPKVRREIMIDVEHLRPNPNNKNKHTKEDISRLAASIGAYGLINPISIRPLTGHYWEIISGEGRWLAVKDELGWQQVPGRVFEDVVGEINATGMRLAENTARRFEFISECQELASLYDKGVSAKILAQNFAESERPIGTKIAIGHLPEDLFKKIRSSEIWSRRAIIDLLPLRLIKSNSGNLNLISKGDVKDRSYFEKIVYDEMIVAIDKVNKGEIKPGAELIAYVAQRRAVLLEDQQEQIIQQELEKRLSEAKAEQEKVLEQMKTQVVQEKQGELAKSQEQLEKALAEARQVRQEKAELLVKQSQELLQARQELSQAHQLELRQREGQSSQRIKELQEGIEQLKKERDQAFSKARKQLEKQFVKEKKELQLLADSQKTEAQKRQELLDSLRGQFDQKIAEQEKRIEESFQAKIRESQQSLENLRLERESLLKEIKSLQDQVGVQIEEIRNLQGEHQQEIGEKEKEISIKDEEIKRLLGEITKVRHQAEAEAFVLVEEETKKRAEEYKVQLDQEYQEYKKKLDDSMAELEKSFQEKQKAAERKQEKRNEESLNHFRKVVTEVEAVTNLLVFHRLESLTKDQLTDFVFNLNLLLGLTTKTGENVKKYVEEKYGEKN